ncbi:MAG TPA: tRNA (N6-threonylcarbamoyladenosine(37)-N6)-methyltransferase TrmO [Rariglobus sp.]|nr:tRNA (N6-threonylcarbamoyladenosine(37)-N6)-methyltransferase TrmO [Rariglobus sp.]
MSSSSLTLQPIGFIRTQKQVKFQARYQPAEHEEERNTLELPPGSNYEQALRDLAGFERVWLLWWFHRNANWRPLVLPPRGPSKRRGVFATRSPHRPNALGMTPVRLLGVKGRTLLLGPCDLVDGTPVFDIKPYVPAYDAFPEAKAGWIDEVDAELAQPARFTVSFSEQAETQLAWLLDGWRVDFRARLVELLSRDPSPHRTRRITKREAGGFLIGCGAWRAVFGVEGETVAVAAIEPGFPMRFLTRPGYEDVPDREAQVAFLECWPSEE